MNDSDKAIAFRKAVSPDEPKVRYAGFQPGSTVLHAGDVIKPGAMPLPNDLRFDRDVGVDLRDGTRIYTDIYRSTADEKVPAIISWSPYGKREGYVHLQDFPLRAGIPQRMLSGLEKFEGPDPAWWCPQGYAIVQPDIRGAYRSEGDLYVWDEQEGRDASDLIDWIAQQEWCNGKVGLAGSSWLGTAQWFIGAERPKNLAALAPWEGMSDAWRHAIATGGVVDPGFLGWLMAPAAGLGGVEDLVEMTKRHPAFDDYWKHKRAAVEQINVPTYVVASWANVLHCMGTFEAWYRLTVEERWLRVHNRLEWPDFYDPKNQQDLLRFFDHYLRDVDNGWETTPTVRFTVTDLGKGYSQDFAEPTFPPATVSQTPYYLDASSLSFGSSEVAHASLTQDAVDGIAVFTLKFDKAADVIGFPELLLYLELIDGDDADIFVKLVKLDASGEVAGRILLPDDIPENKQNWEEISRVSTGPARALYYYDGPWGRKRASHRGDTDPPHDPIYVTPQPVTPGEVVPIRIAFSPTAFHVNAGETLRLTISGANLTPHAVHAEPAVLVNRGQHIIHTGGQFPSKFVLPIAPSVDG